MRNQFYEGGIHIKSGYSFLEIGKALKIYFSKIHWYLREIWYNEIVGLCHSKTLNAASYYE